MIRLFFSLLVVSALVGPAAEAAYWELGAGFNYNRSEYPGGSFSYTKRLGGSVGYNFSDSSTIEIAYQNTYERDHYAGFEDATYDDQVYSVNLVWNVFGREASVQPYFKVGIGQLNRKATIVDSLGRSQIQELDQVTGVLGTGIKFLVTKTFAIRAEGTSYLAGGKIGTWKNNFGATFGFSFYY